MTSLDEKASGGASEDIDLARQSAPGIYKRVEGELVPADEIGTDDFPQYGDFLWVETPHGGQYIEVPASLAEWLVENTEDGDAFRLVAVRKVDGEWQYTAELANDDWEQAVE